MATDGNGTHNFGVRDSTTGQLETYASGVTAVAAAPLDPAVAPDAQNDM